MAIPIVMLVYPVPGRQIPAMTLASHLVEQGAKVTFLCPSHRMSNLTEAKSRGYRPGIEIIELKLDEDKVNAIPDTPFKDVLLVSLIAASFRTYLDNLKHLPSCFIGDEVWYEIAQVARSFNLRWYCLVPQSALALCATLYVRRLDEEKTLPLCAASKTPVDMSSLPVTLTSDEYHTPYLQEYSTQFMDEFKRAALLIHEQASGILVNTFEQLEPTILSVARKDMVINPNAVQILPVGPLMPDINISRGPLQVEAEEEILCSRFLNEHSSYSVVFASFGSIWRCSREQVMAVYEGLEASGFPYIWMVRSEDGFAPPNPRNGGLIISTWAPQLRILSHTSTGLFMTHCGWNSTLESLSCGVPMLATMPRVMDQKINCKLIVDVLKVGVRLTELEKDTIAESVKTIMSSQEIRANSQRIKAAAKEARAFCNQTIKNFLQNL